MRFPFQLPPNRRFDCTGFGENTIDYLITAHSFPKADTKTEISDYIQMAGGQIASMLVGLRRLGARVSYAGRFGTDSGGAFGAQSLIAEGVDISSAEDIHDARTHASFIIVDERTGERTILWKRDPRLAYTIADTPTELAMHARVLHIDAHDPEATLALATSAREHGTIVSADFDHIDAGVLALLPLIDVLITSKDFPHLLTGIDDERGALTEAQRRAGCAVVGMTRGTRGALIYCNGTFTETPALPVPGEVRDTTGAGDAFHAGFIYGLLTGEEIETSARFGAGVAALKCRELGARAGLPTLAELQDYLQNLSSSLV